MHNFLSIVGNYLYAFVENNLRSEVFKDAMEENSHH